MPYIKDTFSILAECAASDIMDTESIVEAAELRNNYAKIEEASIDTYVGPHMIPVMKIDESYYTETQLLYPYMRDYKINSISEALDAVANANNLPAKSVGLLVESEKCVSEMIEKACRSCKTEASKAKAKENVFNKVGKAIGLVDNLKKKGYPVKKKKCK